MWIRISLLVLPRRDMSKSCLYLLLLHFIHLSQRYRVGTSLICALLFRSKLLILESDCEWFDYVAIYKRTNCSHGFFKESDVNDSLLIRVNCLPKMNDLLKQFVFLCPRANHSHRSSLICSFLKSGLSNLAHVPLYKRATVSDLLRLLNTIEWLWALCSGCSWQKSDRSDLLFFTRESLFHSFAHKKRVNC